MVTHCARSAATLRPHPGQRALLANTGLILPPDFDRLVARLLRNGCHGQLGKAFFLKEFPTRGAWSRQSSAVAAVLAGYGASVRCLVRIRRWRGAGAHARART